MAGVVLIATSWPAGLWLWAGGVTLVLAGGFMLFEASKGWCAVRALGFKKPL